MGGPAQGVWGPAGALSKAGHKRQKYSKGKTVFLTPVTGKGRHVRRGRRRACDNEPAMEMRRQPMTGV